MPNIYRFISVAVNAAALTPVLQSQSALATAEAQTAVKVAEKEMQISIHQSTPRYGKRKCSNYRPSLHRM